LGVPSVDIYGFARSLIMRSLLITTRARKRI